MFISDKAALNAVVRALRERLLATDPQLFSSLKFNTLHQIFARLSGYRTQAALLKALPVNLDLKVDAIEEELFRTWSLSDETQRVQAVANFAEALDDLMQERGGSNYALIQIDLLFGMSPIGRSLKYEEEDEVRDSTVDWRSVIEKAAGITVRGGISLPGKEWSPKGFCGREKEFRTSLNGKPLDVEFHELFDTYRSVEPDAAQEHSWSWVPQCFTKSCLLFASVEDLQTSDLLECDLDASVITKLRTYFYRLALEKRSSFDPYMEDHLISGQIRVLVCESCELEEDDGVDVDEEIHSLLKTDMDEVVEECHLDEFIRIGALGEDGVPTGLALEEWVFSCFSNRKVVYPETGISLVSNGFSEGFVGQWMGQLVLALNVFERTGSPDDMNYSSNYGFGAQFLESNPEAKLYFFDYEDEGTFELESVDAAGHFVDGNIPPNVYPALFDKFGESIKHLPPGIEPAYDPSRPAFRTLGSVLIRDHAVNNVVVDDFLDDYGAMSSALIVGLYCGDELMAEFSYCVLKQNPEMRQHDGGTCAELELDADIKDWCTSNKIPLLWNEHEVFRPIGPRQLSRFESQAAFLPTVPSSYIYNSTLPVVMVFDGVARFEVERDRFQKAMSETFEHCVSGVEPFDFRMLSVQETAALPETVRLHDIKAALVDAFQRPIKAPVVVEPGEPLLGGYNLRGTSSPEVTSSVKNTWLSKFVFEQDGIPYMTPKAAEVFLDKLGAGRNAQATVRVDFVGFNTEAVFKGIFHDLL